VPLMFLWNQIVEVLRESIFAYAQACHGNLGYGIVAVTFLARLALFPVMLRIARASAAHQEVMARLQPELAALKLRFKGDAAKLNSEMQRLFQREGVSMIPLGGFLGSFAQVPVLLALYSSVRQAAAIGGRFLWIQNIALPDFGLTAVVAALGVAAAALGPQPSAAQNRTLMILLPSIITVIALSKMAAGVGIYWGVSSAVAVVQGAVTRRRPAPRAA
jgi:YidC/Oxa1 family membrane protein insertase